MKKFISIIAAVCILLTAVPMCVISFAKEGTIDSTEIKWNYNEEDKSLSFEGVGAIPDYSSTSDRPWNELDVESVAIGDGITAIGNLAFCSYESLKSVTLPDGLEKIGNEAFYLCTALESVTLPESLKSIGEAAFDQCVSLKEITFPEGLEEIGARAFYCCENLETASVITAQKLGANIFDGCEKLTEIKFADSIKDIPDAICSGCTALSEVTLPESLRSVGDGAFELCLSLKSVTIPPAVMKIGEKAFGYGKKGAKIDGFEISAYSGTCGSEYAEKNSFAIKNLGNPSYGRCGDDAIWSYNAGTKTLTVSGSGATYDYSKENKPAFSAYTIENIIIGSDITYIGAYIFCDCVLIGMLDLYNCTALTAVGEKAFFNCTGVTFVKANEKLSSIGEKAFGYSALSDDEDYTEYVILIGAENSETQKYADNNDFTFFTYEDFPGFEGKCGDSAKWEYDPVTFTLKITGDGAVYNYTEETGFPPFIEYMIYDLEIEDGITSLGDFSFLNCNIDFVEIPDSVTHIGEYALGYYLYLDTDDQLLAEKNPDFVIACSPYNEAAIKYANENEFNLSLSPYYEFNESAPMIINGSKIIIYNSEITSEAFKKDYFSYIDENTEIVTPSIISTGSQIEITLNNGKETYTVVVIGDVSSDGYVNSIDALMALSSSVGTIELGGEKAEAADVNGDGNINAIDALAILNASVGNISLDQFMPQK